MRPFTDLGSSLREGFNNFQTLVWLRWRIRLNQMRKGSLLGKVVAAILLVSFAATCFGLLFVGILLGVFSLRSVPSEYYFLFWDGFCALFCFLWFGRMATDIQRTDAITFDRILHLPVSFSQAFVINYLSSLINVTFLSLCALGFGFIFGSCFSLGTKALWIPIPFVFFLIAITALTYQVQGWLAALMSNPRRRQMIVIIVPLIFVFLSQIPAIFATRFAKNQSHRTRVQEAPALPTIATPAELPDTENGKQSIAMDGDSQSSQVQELKGELQPTKSTQQEQAETTDEVNKRNEKRETERAANRALWLDRIRMLNLWFPPFWMAGCVESITSGTPRFLLLSFAMALVGIVSLRRNYIQSLRYYRGETDARMSANRKPAKPVTSTAAVNTVHKLRLVERCIPFVSEDTSAIITMTLQSMTRAPEVKLYLLLPLIVPFVLFGVLQTWQLPPIDELKAAIIVGFTACSLFITSGMLGNCFAYDRAGFRAFVLSPIRRERILLGRNLATTPFLLLQTLLLAIAIGLYFGMAIDKLVASVLLSAAILPLYCLLTNLMSIVTPFPLAAGSIQPKQFNLVPVLLSLLLSMLMPGITMVALLPLALEWSIDRVAPAISAIPIAMLFSFFWLFASLSLYRWLLPWEGKLLMKREIELLRVVTSKIE